MNCIIRPLEDIDQLLEWRKEVMTVVFGQPPSDELMAANKDYYSRHIADGSHIAVVAEIDGIRAGCGAVCLTEELPSPDNSSGRCGYIMNIYVRPEYRSQGVGHQIVRNLVTVARESGCDKIYLETTPGARSLYNSIGFKELPGIMKYEDVHNPES